MKTPWSAVWIWVFMSLHGATADAARSPNVELLLDAHVSSAPNGLVAARDGNLFGTTASGGDNGTGGFFRISATGIMTTLSSMPATRRPPSQLIEGSDGSFYGIGNSDRDRGLADQIVRISRDGTSVVVFDFRALSAAGVSTLVSGSDGNLYGTTTTGGSNGTGAAFALTIDGKLIFMTSFTLANSQAAELLQANDGTLYGLLAPSNSQGVAGVFRVTTDGVITIVRSFEPANETYPYTFSVGEDGNFYGFGVSAGATVFFRMSTVGEIVVLNPAIDPDAAGPGFVAVRPNPLLVLGSDGNFYTAHTSDFDTTTGAFLPGRVFRITPKGEVTLVHKFGGQSEGLYPANLTPGADGQLRGTSTKGGGGSGGTVFRLTTSGEVTPLYSFNLAIAPASPLTESPDGNFYGTTEVGGSNFSGTIFRLTPSGSINLTIDLGGPQGAEPHAPLTVGFDGSLYGTTSIGGSAGVGTLFRLDATGALTTLFNFSSSSGFNPSEAVVNGNDGLLYGLTPRGGPGSYGTVFRASLSGGLTTIASFDGTNGAAPLALVKGAGGNFYGITQKAAPQKPATAFRITPDGMFATIHTFSASTEGFPKSLTSSSDGNLYGLSLDTIANEWVFRLGTDGTVSRVASLGTNVYPQEAMTPATDGNLYLQIADAQLGLPTRVVRISPEGIVSTVARFDGADGRSFRKLVQASHREFYSSGGVNGKFGNIFRLYLLAPQISSIDPEGAAAGSQVTISGTSLTGATRVTFNGVPAQFTVISDTQISASVPAGATATAVSVTTPAGIAAFPPGSVPPGPALNISTRVNVGTGDDALIGGFIVQGSAAKKVIIRAIGPSLAAAGVSGVLQNPVLELHDSSGDIIAANDDWQSSADKQAIIDTGIPPLDPQEAAIVRALEPGNYTAVVRGSGDKTGVGLVEVYDLDRASGKLANISTRGSVQSGNNVMIGGFIIGGDAPGKVLVRAIGPSLANANPPISSALSDPQLELRDADGNLMAANDNWQEGAQTQEISDTTLAPSDPKEAAILASLNPGNYTAIVSGVNNSTGIALVEVYKLN